MTVKDYKDLKVWQKGMEIVDRVYSVTDSFPKEELYGLISQMRRSSVSIPSNIAEGFVRKSTKEYNQFLYISLGSYAELETQLIIADKRKYSENNKLKEIIALINSEMKMLISLTNKLKNRKDNLT